MWGRLKLLILEDKVIISFHMITMDFSQKFNSLWKKPLLHSFGCKKIIKRLLNYQCLRRYECDKMTAAEVIIQSKRCSVMCNLGSKAVLLIERKAKIYVGVFCTVENTFEEWKTSNLCLVDERFPCNEHNLKQTKIFLVYKDDFYRVNKIHNISNSKIVI